MTDVTLFVGLDVHKKTIAVALVDGTAGADVRFYGTIANTPGSCREVGRKALTASSPADEDGKVRLRGQGSARQVGHGKCPSHRRGVG